MTKDLTKSNIDRYFSTWIYPTIIWKNSRASGNTIRPNLIRNEVLARLFVDEMNLTIKESMQEYAKYTE